jgi:hypothetical protein
LRSNEYGRGSGSGVVAIPYQGSRSRDFTLADKEFAAANGGRERPAGYTWHHANYDPATGMGEMQLVKTDVHAATSHAGGVADFKEAHGLGYDNDEAIKLVEERGLLKGRSPCK